MSKSNPFADDGRWPKYALFQFQEGGCDYTIGCGYKLTEIEGAESLEGAVRIASGKEPPSYPQEDEEDRYWTVETDGEFAIKSATVFEITRVQEINLAALLVRRTAEKHAKDKVAADNHELAEFERLKKKLGK